MKRKRNIIILTIGVFILSITTVYAITIIRASDVTYDNSKSNGSSTNVQGAIDELYSMTDENCSSECNTESLINENMISYITNLSKSDTTNLVYDDTVDKNLRYIGINPNNYVEFNGELWRIIGVMNNVKDEKGNSASRIKLIRAESIGNLKWNNVDEVNWGTSTLQTLLNNGDYYNRKGDYKNIGLTDISKKMITKVVWPLGGTSMTETADVTASKIYNDEYSVVYNGKANKWTGYVGLIRASDYGFAVGGVLREYCLSKNLSTYSTSCHATDWLWDSNYSLWTMSQNAINNGMVLIVYGPHTSIQGQLYRAAPSYDFHTQPVVYLDTKLLVTKGKGTILNPYKISFVEEKEDTCEVKDETKNLITKISNLASIDKTNLITDDTVDKNIRYVGSDPNNYIKFNDELWRIIGVMNNVKDSNDITSSRVKIIKSESIGKYAWDSSGSYGNNDWSQAKLMKTLNEGPYWNKKSGICYNGNNNQETDCDFSKIGLTDEAKSMIGNITWNLGGRSNSSALTSTFYTNERETTVYSGRPTEWNGYVGLMYPSDYGYAVGGSVRSSCLSGKLSDYNNNNCYKNDWLYLYNATQWTLSPYSGTEMGVFYLYMSGLVSNGNAFYNVDVRPVVYLNTDIEVTSGAGTIDNPYIIKKG